VRVNCKIKKSHSKIRAGEALKAIGKTADAEKTFAKGLSLDGDFEVLANLLMYSKGNVFTSFRN